MINISTEQLGKVFEMWDTRYRDSPEKYWNDVDHLLRNTPVTYGSACAAYFESLVKELYGE